MIEYMDKEEKLANHERHELKKLAKKMEFLSDFNDFEAAKIGGDEIASIQKT